MKTTFNAFIRRVPNWLIYLLGAVPVLWLFALALNGRLGADPINTLEDKYGLWALWLLIATLSITPLTRLGLQVAKLRRPLGVLTFFYIFAHLLVWLVLDHSLNMARIFEEILKRPFITIGMAGFLVALPLALTSNNRSLRKLGPKRWRRLHKLTYVLAILAPIHYLLVVKGWPYEPFLYLGVILALLAWRVWARK